jgi:hypothetical protein
MRGPLLSAKLWELGSDSAAAADALYDYLLGF